MSLRFKDIPLIGEVVCVKARQIKGRSFGSNPLVAALLSLLVAGLGQMYLGLWGRGLAFIVADLLSYGAWEILNLKAGLVVNLIVSVAAVVDAYHRAKLRRAVKTAKKKKSKSGRELYV